MYGYDPRTIYGQYGFGPGPVNTSTAWGPSPFQHSHAPQQLGWNPNSAIGTGMGPGYGMATNGAPDLSFLLHRLEDLRMQVNAIHELLRMQAITQNAAQTGYGSGYNTAYTSGPSMYPHSPRAMTGFTNEIVRVRESDSHLYCDIFLPQLTVGDVEVEVTGNRILCRTRIPVAPLGRWFVPTTTMPRGFELFELPDGRIECSWLCPVAFNAKEVEAAFRDGFLSIIVTKTEVNTASRQHIKVAKEATRRTPNEMNS